jgi:hypothetical protein
METPVELTGRPAADAFCRWCAKPAGECDQVSCRRDLDPPRACPTCGRRLRVVVIPTGYTATCREHGAVAG